MKPPWCTPLKEQQNQSLKTERQRWIRGIKKRFMNNMGNKPKLAWEGENPVCRAPSGGQEDSLWASDSGTNSQKHGKFIKTWNVRTGETLETISGALRLPDEESEAPLVNTPHPWLLCWPPRAHVPAQSFPSLSASEGRHLRNASPTPFIKRRLFFFF